jgi:hypothetical protein
MNPLVLYFTFNNFSYTKSQIATAHPAAEQRGMIRAVAL